MAAMASLCSLVQIAARRGNRLPQGACSALDTRSAEPKASCVLAHKLYITQFIVYT